MSDEKKILWTPRRKREIILRLLKGESSYEIERELVLSVATLHEWRDRFLEAGLEGLGGKSKALHDAEKELDEAHQTIGRLAMELKLQGKQYAPRSP